MSIRLHYLASVSLIASATIACGNSGASGNSGVDATQHVIDASVVDDASPTHDANAFGDSASNAADAAVHVIDGSQTPDSSVTVDDANVNEHDDAHRIDGHPTVDAHSAVDDAHMATADAHVVTDDANIVHDAAVSSDAAVGAPGATVLIDVGPSGKGGNYGGNLATKQSMSNDGRYVVFLSSSNNLIANGGTSTTGQVYVRDTTLNTTTLVSINASGVASNGAPLTAAISGDGSVIAFSSYATNLLSVASNGRANAFAYQMSNGALSLISVSSTGVQGNGQSYQVALNNDGSLIAFTSTGATNLVSETTGGGEQVYLRDVTAGTTTLMSVNSSGVAGDDDSSGPALSANGEYLVFESDADNLTSFDVEYNGANVFLVDLTTHAISNVSYDFNGAITLSEMYPPTITSDGRFIAYGFFTDDGDDEYCDMEIVDTVGAGSQHIVDPDQGCESPSLTDDGTTRTYLEGNYYDGDINDYIYNVYAIDNSASEDYLISSAPNGYVGDGNSSQAELTPDGHHIVFMSSASDLLADSSVIQDDQGNVFWRTLP